MTDDPIWPGVAEYLYQAASSELVTSDGTWIVPSGLTPRCSSLESTPRAGISTDTGTERGSRGPRPPGLRAPAADAEGCGACRWDMIATRTMARPSRVGTTPATPARRAGT